MIHRQTRLQPSPLADNHSNRGVALLITVTLLAFLVLLLVAITALTRVETQVAFNQQACSQARQNALMALNIAIGQLQQHAGADSRLTAQANLLGSTVANPWFTGVWTADAGGAPVQRAWLVSGNENDPLRFGPNSALGRENVQPEVALVMGADGLATNGPETANPNRVQLVGAASATMTGSGLAHGGVVVPGVPLNAVAPGFATERTLGRYAFWIGDQGVKASLALPDRSSEVTYAPWFDADATGGYDQRSRIRQQIATAPTFFRRRAGVEELGFDPLTTANAPLLSRVLSLRHVDLLAPAVAAAPLSTFRRDYFHTFTDRAYAVLANTLPLTSAQRGLQRDLSLAPGLLGPAFVAHANLASYMEVPAAGNAAVPPITTYDSERRRYRHAPPVATAATVDDPEIQFKVGPVLNSFMLQFRVLRGTGGTVEIQARLFVELWNPYASALVPEELTLEITGLPKVTVTDAGAGGSGDSVEVDLQTPPALLTDGSPARPVVVKLPFVANGDADRASLLPGRMYAWRTETGTPATASLRFYDKVLNSSWDYRTVVLGATRDELKVEAAREAVLQLRLKRADGSVLATYTSPTFPAFSIPDVEAPSGDDNWKFGFGFRLRQPSALNRDRDWLCGAGQDFRGVSPTETLFGPFNELLDIDPDAYVEKPSTSSDVANFLVYRAMGTARNSTRSANLDQPVFELPRFPFLSVGELQHLLLPANRPFAAGNSWGGRANSWFDRFFFSGLTSAGGGPNLAAGQPPPNWNLQPLTAQVASAGALSSQHLLQAGGFNVNSALPEAWRAVLSSVRFSPAQAFRRANIDDSSTVNACTGSQPDPGSSFLATTSEVLNDLTLADDAHPVANPVGGPAFFRFPQSAQETYYWANTAIDGDFRKQAFRQGVRGGDQVLDGSTLQTLTTTQVDQLASAIVSRSRTRATTAGPFASIQSFLAPHPGWGDRNLLEQAIVDAGINPASIAPVNPVASLGDIGFSSLTLTSGDIMTALAPYLRARSDTFVVRTFGESLNPATQDVAGRAWCEAVVQRLPAPHDASETNVAAPAAAGFGRGFRILQFRWLTPSDI